MGATIQITDGASPLVNSIEKTVADRVGLHRAAAEGVLVIVQRSLVEMAGTEHNKFGVRGGFWGRMLAGTVAAANESTGVVRMPREVALRYFGGTVTPQKSKFLAIPARAEAYGKSPRQFDDLRFAPSGRGGVLIQNEQTTISYGRAKKDGSRTRKTQQQGGGVFFFLVPSATIQPNANVLPDEAGIAEAAKGGIDTFTRTQIARSGSGGA